MGFHRQRLPATGKTMTEGPKRVTVEENQTKEFKISCQAGRLWRTIDREKDDGVDVAPLGRPQRRANKQQYSFPSLAAHLVFFRTRIPAVGWSLLTCVAPSVRRQRTIGH